MSETICISIDGKVMAAQPGDSILQTRLHGPEAVTANIGCMGQGVCGSCRCLVRKAGERETVSRLACETEVEDGMQVSFIDYYQPDHVHRYRPHDLRDGWQALPQLQQTFPETAHCRHCGGCDRACPRGIPVQQGIALASRGELPAAAALFDACIMCNLCTLACPENIRPNHVGLYLRRAQAIQNLRPGDLLRRLDQQARGQLSIDTTAHLARSES
ncbi:4Fe-4S dicluster domain-containing protein [Aquitalea aquatica]|uniref:Ferredoxin n=1 Tax=Aquitalea aquatica TaxID=3044273 RepID=A0A838Y3Q9_9NEIS|nr:ferredoxin [Aquitalea magnusonii]MBA4709316.1 ferredoxin [Aquitalea magnusonii]